MPQLCVQQHSVLYCSSEPVPTISVTVEEKPQEPPSNRLTLSSSTSRKSSKEKARYVFEL